MKTTKIMQTGGSTRPVPGQKKPKTKKPKITSAMTNGIKSPNLPPKKRGTGLILKDKPTQEGIYKPKMQKGGSTGKTKKYKTKNSYSEYDFSDGRPMFTTVESPDKSYKKNIEWMSGNKKPYEMTVTKGGKTNKFQLSKEQAISQRKKVKKTMGFQKGGIKK